MKTTNQLNWLLAMTAIAALAMPLSSVFAQGKGNGNGNGNGGGGGGPGLEMQIIQLQTADGVGTHDEANDINDLRHVAGRATLPTGDLAAAHWSVVESNDVVQSTLQLLDGGHVATAINNLGEIVGQTYGPYGNPVGVYWANTNTSAVELPMPAGYDVSLPDRINDDRVICGMVAVDGDSQSNIPVLWQVTTGNDGPLVSQPILLPSFGPGSSAQDVNNSDASGVFQVVGHQRTTGTPLLWEVQILPDGSLSIPANPQVLDLDEYSLATGINNSAAICGRTETDAIVWSGGTASILDRPGKGKRKVPRAWAWDIGDGGVVVGEAGPLIDSRACLWDGKDGALTWLDDFLDPDSPLAGLGRANAVNAFGEIVGSGWYGAFIAIPASTP